MYDLNHTIVTRGIRSISMVKVLYTSLLAIMCRQLVGLFIVVS